jgi:RNA polymerase sigma-70 factor (ECF subfamily)
MAFFSGEKNMENFAQQLSFEQLAAEHSPTLLRYLRRYVGDRTVADDLLQETLIRMARGLPDFAGRASVKTWAFSIATHVAIDYFRKPERRLHIVEVNEATDLANADRTIDERIIVDEMNACIRQVIDSLPEDYRAALVLHDLEGLTAQQVAEICTCSLATTKIRIHRARNRLKEALQQQCEFYRDGDNVFRCDRKPD